MDGLWIEMIKWAVLNTLVKIWNYTLNNISSLRWFNSIFDLIDNTLSDDQMELTAGDISEYECKLAIQQM